MALSNAATAEDLDHTRGFPRQQRRHPGVAARPVSWGAIAAAAAAAASLSQGFPTTTTPAQAA